MRMFFTVALLWLHLSVHAQATLSADRLQAIFTDSRNVEIPPVLLKEIKEASRREIIEDAMMIKNLIYVKAILNPELSYAERSELCDLAIRRFERQNGCFPVSIVKRLQVDMASPAQTRKP